MLKRAKRKLAVVFATCLILSLFPSYLVEAADQQVTTAIEISTDEMYVDETVTVDLQIQGEVLQGIVVPSDIILVLDRSGSMSTENRIDAMKTAAKEFINMVDYTQHRVGAIAYDNSIRSADITDDKAALDTFIDSLYSGGTTRTDLALERAATMLAGRRPGTKPIIVLMTDGSPDDRTATLQAAEAVKNQGMIIYTIAALYSSSNPATDQANLDLMTISTSGGHHHFILGTDKMTDVYKEVCGQIGQANIYDVVITQQLNSVFELVSGSADTNIPQPVISGNKMTWSMNELRDETLHLQYQLKVKSGTKTGTYKHTSVGTVTYKTYAGETKTVTIDAMPIQVKNYKPEIETINQTDYKITGGENVVLTGKFFDPKAVVKVGNTTISTRTITGGNKIEFKMPAHVQGTDAISVTNPSGDSDSVSVRFMAIPIISGVSPASGPYAGGTSVRITTKYVMSGAKVTFDGVEGSVTAVYDNCVKAVTPFIDKAGLVDIVITNPDGTSATAVDAFCYEDKPVPPLPVLNGISPSSGLEGVATSVSIPGKNFRKGPNFKVTVGGVDATVTGVYDNRVVAKVPTTLPAGTYDVVVINDDGTQATLPNAYTYTPKPTPPAPTLTKISPSSGMEGVATAVSVSGKNFRKGSNFKVTVGGVEADVTAVYDNRVAFKVPTTLPAGIYDVTVTNDDGTQATLSDAYTYTQKPALELTGISPASGMEGVATSVSIAGKNFEKGTNFKVTVGGVDAVVSAVYSNRTVIKVPTTLAAGIYDVVMTNNDGKVVTLSGAYTYTPKPTPPAPTLTSISPPNGVEGAATTVSVYGKNFRNGTNFKVTVGGVDADVTKVYDNRVVFKTPTTLPAGIYDVIVKNDDGTESTMAAAYTYTPKPTPPAPTLTSISPNSGTEGIALSAAVYGMNFRQGANFKVFLEGTEAIVKTVYDNKVVFQIPATLAVGTYDLVVRNDDGTETTLTDAYTCNPKPLPPAPTLTSISPASGVEGTATSVSISGRNFRKGTNFKVTVGGEEADITAVYDNRVTFKVPITLGAGIYDVVVTNDDGTETIMSGAYTYTAKPVPPAPTLTSISPASGIEGVATSVSISGKNFRKGVNFKVTVGGVDADVTAVYDNRVVFKVPITLLAGVYDVTVTNDDGTEATMTDAYTCTPKPTPPAPTLTGVSTDSGAVGINTGIRITGKDFRNGTNFRVTVGGVDASITGVYDNSVRINVPNTLPVGTYDIVVINDDGTQSTMPNAFTYK